MSTRAEEPDRFDLAIIGAGPAGLVAAITAADAGVRVALIDAGERPGGQYFRHGRSDEEPGATVRLHHDWDRFAQLRAQLEAHCRRGAVVYLSQHAVFAIEPADAEFRVHALADERARTRRTVSAGSLLLATGAADRQLPFPGWTMPGVVTAGGAQALLKGSHVAAGRRVVVAGAGPFLLAVADGLLASGIEVVAVVEAGDPRRYLRDPVGLAAAGMKTSEAVMYAARLARHRVPYLTRRAVVAAYGNGRVDAVRIAPVDREWRVRPGTQRRLACDLLAVGYGFTPRTELAVELGCDVDLTTEGTLVVRVDANQRTSIPTVFAVGELTGIGGVDLALVEGEIAGAAIAGALGRQGPVGSARLAQLRRRRSRLQRFARSLAAVHQVGDGWIDWSADDTVVCRCEEVPYASIREAATQLGAADARGVKLLARPGMGWCQGQICGLATAAITASCQGRAVTRDDVLGMARRPLAQPVPLEVLASFAPDAQADG